MPPPDTRFERLANLARRAPENAPDRSMSPALATRVLARIRPAERAAESPWVWLSIRAVPVAGVVAALCFFSDRIAGTERPLDEQRLAGAIVDQQLAP